MGEFIGWIRYFSKYWREFVPKEGDSYEYMERLANFSDVTEGRSSVRPEERVERVDWVVNS